MPPALSTGLENVYACTSALSSVDGKKGLLRYRGYDIADLAEHAAYEEIVYLLLYGERPNNGQLKTIRNDLHKEATLPPHVLGIVNTIPGTAHPLAVLRTAINSLSCHKKKKNMSIENIRSEGLKLIALFPTITAAFERLRTKEKIIAPHPGLSHAANFLYMLHGKPPPELESQTINTCFVLHAEHELNASAFAARVAASTNADIYAAVTAAIATFSGPLHGGANEDVIAMLNDITTHHNAENHILTKLKNKEKIPGFGHRVYKVKDPRAIILKRLAHNLAHQKKDFAFLLIAEEIERIVERELSHKNIHANVDFYAAITYHLLGIPGHLFSSVFACARIAGWVAHILEQYGDNRLIRPLSIYTGPEPRTFTFTENR